MGRPRGTSRILTSAVRDVEKLVKRAKASGAEGIPLAELLERVNRTTARFLPEEEGRDSRVSRVFTSRSFRHYQTLGCIDPPERCGHQAVYGVRHFVQALLVRRLLWERVPAEAILGLMGGLSTEETRQMLVEGIEIVVRQGGGETKSASSRSAGPGLVETWRRVAVAPGIELHVSEDHPKPRAGEVERLLVRVEKALRRCLR